MIRSKRRKVATAFAKFKLESQFIGFKEYLLVSSTASFANMQQRSIDSDRDWKDKMAVRKRKLKYRAAKQGLTIVDNIQMASSLKLKLFNYFLRWKK
jgi:hypothetical protein